jgi:hypothetical protein
MPIRIEQVIELIHDARRWSDGVRDYIPELGCSSCGRAVMPLCGLSVNRKVTPFEYKDVVLKSRKMMMETGKHVNPMTVQVISASNVVILYEKAMDCVELIDIPGGEKKLVFTSPIPTAFGLMCKDCMVCQVCYAPAIDRVRCCGSVAKLCNGCMDMCAICKQGKMKHHDCCTRGNKKESDEEDEQGAGNEDDEGME